VLQNGILKPAQVPILPIGADMRIFRPASESLRATRREELGFDRARPIILYIGRLQGIKRFNLFVNVLRRLGPSYQAIALTPTPTTTEEHALLADFRTSIEAMKMNGQILHGADVANVLTVADLTLSTSKYESLGISMLESLSSGVPVVTTAEGGPADFISAGNGLQLVTDDPDVLAHGVLASNLAEGLDLKGREAVRKTVAHRGPDSVAKMLVEAQA
jgi:glycosyltransferase involved in cell wall biosynthesis